MTFPTDFSKTLQNLEAARAGDASAAEELWDRYWEKLVPAVHIRMDPEMRDRVQTVDVVQSVFLEAVREAEQRSFASEAQFRAWLNALVGEKVRRHKEMAEEKGGEAPDLSGTILEEFSQLDSMEVALGRLSPEERELIVMRYFEDLDDSEIADKLGAPQEEAARRVQRAVASLAREMDA